MSTRSTIVCGEDFHLYHDLNDRTAPSAVYLELTRAYFEASPREVTVRIPWADWEAIVNAAIKEREKQQAWKAKVAACDHEWNADYLSGVEYCGKCYVNRGEEP